MRDRVSTILVILLILLGGLYVRHVDSARARDGRQAHDALCLYRAGLKSDVQEGAKALHRGRIFINTHPRGAFGYTQKQLWVLHRQQANVLDAQRQRLGALSIITHCEREKNGSKESPKRVRHPVYRGRSGFPGRGD